MVGSDRARTERPPQDLQPLEQMLSQQHWGNAEMAARMGVFNAFFGQCLPGMFYAVCDISIVERT